MNTLPEQLISRGNLNNSAAIYYGLLWHPGDPTYRDFLKEKTHEENPTTLDIQLAGLFDIMCGGGKLSELGDMASDYRGKAFLCGLIHEPYAMEDNDPLKAVRFYEWGIGFRIGLTVPEKIDFGENLDRKGGYDQARLLLENISGNPLLP